MPAGTSAAKWSSLPLNPTAPGTKKTLLLAGFGKAKGSGSVAVSDTGFALGQSAAIAAAGWDDLATFFKYHDRPRQ